MVHELGSDEEKEKYSRYLFRSYIEDKKKVWIYSIIYQHPMRLSHHIYAKMLLVLYHLICLHLIRYCLSVRC